MDNTVLIQERLPMILDKLPVPEDWYIQIVDPSRPDYCRRWGTGFGNGRSSFSSYPRIRRDFPPWQILISHRDPGAVDRHYNFRRNAYILAVVFVMAVLFFGGFMAIRSTAKELELARLKSEFVSTVSHEFRTPLMSIRYLSEMLDTERVDSEDKKKAYYGKINKESERLSRLIENMLDFSKIEAGMKGYQFESLSIEDLVKDVTDRFREYVGNKPVTLECEITEHSTYIRADRGSSLEGIAQSVGQCIEIFREESGDSYSDS